MNNNGYKTAIIAFVINILLTLFTVNTFGVIASGIYLGYSKEKGEKTNLVFYILSLISLLFIDTMIGQPPGEDMANKIFVLIFSNAILAVIPLGISYLVGKILKR